MIKVKDNKFKCIDCEGEIKVRKDVMNNEILTCSWCSMEYQVTLKDGKIEINELVFEGSDWGE